MFKKMSNLTLQENYLWDTYLVMEDCCVIILLCAEILTLLLLINEELQCKLYWHTNVLQNPIIANKFQFIWILRRYKIFLEKISALFVLLPTSICLMIWNAKSNVELKGSCSSFDILINPLLYNVWRCFVFANDVHLLFCHLSNLFRLFNYFIWNLLETHLAHLSSLLIRK